jgi:hypothetical protein
VSAKIEYLGRKSVPNSVVSSNDSSYTHTHTHTHTHTSFINSGQDDVPILPASCLFVCVSLSIHDRRGWPLVSEKLLFDEALKF